MALYTPPLGKCTACEEYIGQPSTGEIEKDNTRFGEEFETNYFCPVCSDTTPWVRIHGEDLASEVRETQDIKISEDIESSVQAKGIGESEYTVWQPDYRS